MVRKTIKNYTTTIAVEKIVGNSKALQPLKKSFLKAIKNQNPNEIAKTTAEYVASSDTALKNLVKVTKMFDFVEEEFNKEKLNYEETHPSLKGQGFHFKSKIIQRDEKK